jgi:hypothetical protein
MKFLCESLRTGDFEDLGGEGGIHSLKVILKGMDISA